ncbi:hypothetical protein GGF50DRAFT_112601 [Schizophyllum commune]
MDPWRAITCIPRVFGLRAILSGTLLCVDVGLSNVSVSMVQMSTSLTTRSKMPQSELCGRTKRITCCSSTQCPPAQLAQTLHSHLAQSARIVRVQASALGALWVLGGVTLLARTPRRLDGDLELALDFDFDGDYASPRALSGFRPSARGALWVLGGESPCSHGHLAGSTSDFDADDGTLTSSSGPQILGTDPTALVRGVDLTFDDDFDSACSAIIVRVQDHSVKSSPVRT